MAVVSLVGLVGQTSHLHLLKVHFQLSHDHGDESVRTHQLRLL